MSHEQDLVERGEQGVAALFDRHASAVFRLAYALLRDADDAQDVLQETFVIAWRKRRTIALVDGSALPWLLATARLVALAARRRAARRRTTAVPEEALHTIPAATEADDAASLREALAALPAADRAVVELVLVQGLSYAEAAQRLGLTTSAAGKRLQRARTRLRSELRADARSTIEGSTP